VLVHRAASLARPLAGWHWAADCHAGPGPAHRQADGARPPSEGL